QKTSTVQYLRDNALKLKAWGNATKAKGLSDAARAFMTKVNQALEVRENEEKWAEKWEALGPEIQDLSNESWQQVAFAYAVALGELNDTLKGSAKLPSITPYTKVLDNPTDEKYVQRFRSRILEDIALKNAAEAIAKLYCDNRKDRR